MNDHCSTNAMKLLVCRFCSVSSSRRRTIFIITRNGKTNSLTTGVGVKFTSERLRDRYNLQYDTPKSNDFPILCSLEPVNDTTEPVRYQGCLNLTKFYFRAASGSSRAGEGAEGEEQTLRQEEPMGRTLRELVARNAEEVRFIW